MHLLGVTLPYGFTGLFSSFFTDVGNMADDVYGTLSIFTYVLCFAGLLMTAYRMQMGGDFGALGMQLFGTLIVTIALRFLPGWVDSAQTVAGFAMLDSMGTDIGDIATSFVEEVAIFVGAELALVLVELTVLTSMIAALITLLVIIVVAIVAVWVWVAVLLAYIVQTVSLQLGVAVAPIFLGMFMFPPTKETATKYFTGLIGILFWPLGWGIGFKLVDLLLDVWHDILIASTVLALLTPVWASVIDGFGYVVIGMMFWTMIKKAPPLVNRAITTGTQIGAGLVSAGIASAGSTASSAISAAGSVASSAVSLAGTAAGAAIGSVVAPGAGTAAGAGIGGAIGGAAGSAISGGANAVAGGISGAAEGLAGMSEGA